MIEGIVEMPMSVKKAIFPVAGLGTRFLPATKAQPKEMLPVVDKPLIQYAVEEAYAAGVREMIFVTGRHKRPIEDHFDMTFELEVALEQAGKQDLLDVVRSVKPDDMECIYVRQAQALGLGHAVLCAQRLVGNDPFAVLLADDLMVGAPPVLKQMVDQFEEWQARSWRCRKCRPSRRAATASWPARAVNERLVDVTQHRREAGARSRAVAPGRGRPLHPDAGRVPRDRQRSRAAWAARSSSPTASPRCCGARRSLPTATRASATTAAARKASCRPTSNWRWPTRELGPGFREFLRGMEL